MHDYREGQARTPQRLFDEMQREANRVTGTLLSGQSQERDQPEVARALEVLTKGLVEAENQLSRLSERLAPVLLPSPAPPVDKALEAGWCASSPVGRAICDCARRVESLRSDLAALNRAIAV